MDGTHISQGTGAPPRAHGRRGRRQRAGGFALHMGFVGVELRKIARMPLVWSIVIVFAFANLTGIASAHAQPNIVARHNYAGAVTLTIGGRVGPDFDRALARVSAGEDAVATDTGTTGTTDTTGATAADETTAATVPEATDDATATAAANAPIIIDARIPADSTMDADQLHRQLTAVTRGATNTLDLYAASGGPGMLREWALAQTAGDPVATWLMQRKYDLYDLRVAHLAATGAAMDLAAGSATDPTLIYWFRMTGYLFFETCAMAVLLMALTLGYERTARIEQLMMATRVGRRLAGPKVLAGLIAAVTAFALLTAAVVVPYLMLFDVRGVWGASMASQFNTVFGSEPFVTWWDMTIGQYLFARLGLGLALTVCFSLATAAVALVVRNTYAVAGVVFAGVLAVAGMVGAGHMLGLPWLTWAAGLNPVGVLMLRERWFTELGLDAPTAFWETGVTALSLAYLLAASLWARRAFRRRDLT